MSDRVSPLSVLSAALLGTVLLSGCTSVPEMPAGFAARVVETQTFPIYTVSKLSAPGQPVRVYIEGDGRAFNAHGRPSSDPTPHGTLVRRLAFSDPAPNVVYLARPCQYVTYALRCKPAVWTTARFSREAVAAETEALRAVAGSASVVLIGFSGGAQIAGLMSVLPGAPAVQKLVTVAGNLDHPAWCRLKHLHPLTGSLDLNQWKAAYLQIPQVHFTGEKDPVIDPALTRAFTGGRVPVRPVPGATHNKGWDAVFDDIHREN